MKKKTNKTTGKKLSARQLAKEVFQLFKRQPKKQLNPKQVIKKLKVANNRDSVQHAINTLVEKKQLVEMDDYKYKLNRAALAENSRRENVATLEGRVDMTRSGAAYIVVEGRENDVFIHQKNINTALNGDRVKIRAWTARGRRRPEGEILEVLERAAEQFVGTLNVFNQIAVVSVDRDLPFDIVIDQQSIKDAKTGDKVVAKVTDWQGDRFRNPIGEIIEVLGKPGTSDIEMKSILVSNGFDLSFPPSVLEETAMLPDVVSPQEINRRRDFREVTTFTIDPVDAKDFDDALSVERLENGNTAIGIHIADVTHFVRPGSALDQEALKRSTSVYLVDRVCPMLPERISNVLCSLRPEEEKLTFSAVFELDKQAKVVNRWFGKGMIYSDRRFNYQEAQGILNEGKGDFYEELNELNKIAKMMRKRRFKEGAIDFDSEEVRFRLDESGKPIEIYVKERMDTNMLIEEFMLLANREVAEFIGRKEQTFKEQIPFVYRVHDEPDQERVEELARFAQNMGLHMDVSNPKAIARSYNRMMYKAETDPGLKLLAPLAIRTMAKAEYTTNNIGHYGLGFSHYSHFTSPIRRYADVHTHRLLEKNLESGAIFKTNPTKLEEDCKHISRQERRATDAERESIKYKQVEYIMDHVGETFTGVINGLADFGVFVELVDSRCEGRIAFEHMDESYDMGEGRLTIRGRRTGKVLRMGDPVRVRIRNANLQKRQIDLELVEVLERPKTTQPQAEVK